MRNIPCILLSLLLTACAIERAQTGGEKVAAARVEATASIKDGAVTVSDTARVTKEAARQVAIAQASSNLEPIAQAVAAKGETGLANITRDQKKTIDGALDIPASQYPAPTVDRDALIKDAEAARGIAQKRADELQSKFDAAAAAARTADEARQRAEADARAAKALADEEKAKADAAASKAWWLQAGGVALGVVTTLAGLAARLGLPGGQLVELGLNVITPHLARRREVATAAVAAGDVGRSALNILDTVDAEDPALADALAAKITDLTKGRTGNVEGLFKLAAKSFTTDQNGKHVDGVDALLNDVRGSHIPTAGGVATVLSSLLKR